MPGFLKEVYSMMRTKAYKHRSILISLAFIALTIALGACQANQPIEEAPRQQDGVRWLDEAPPPPEGNHHSWAIDSRSAEDLYDLSPLIVIGYPAEQSRYIEFTYPSPGSHTITFKITEFTVNEIIEGSLDVDTIRLTQVHDRYMMVPLHPGESYLLFLTPLVQGQDFIYAIDGTYIIVDTVLGAYHAREGRFTPVALVNEHHSIDRYSGEAVEAVIEQRRGPDEAQPRAVERWLAEAPPAPEGNHHSWAIDSQSAEDLYNLSSLIIIGRPAEPGRYVTIDYPAHWDFTFKVTTIHVDEVIEGTISGDTIQLTQLHASCLMVSLEPGEPYLLFLTPLEQGRVFIEAIDGTYIIVDTVLGAYHAREGRFTPVALVNENHSIDRYSGEAVEAVIERRRRR
jgi:hypothetical protein